MGFVDVLEAGRCVDRGSRIEASGVCIMVYDG